MKLGINEKNLQTKHKLWLVNRDVTNLAKKNCDELRESEGERKVKICIDCQKIGMQNKEPEGKLKN